MTKSANGRILRLCVSSSSGSGGKTLLSLGLGRVFSNRGLIAQPFKKGPDYIDAAWLSAACRQPASNLDPYFQDASGIRQTFQAALARSAMYGKTSIALVEGNRGLYDGLDEAGSYSTAALARVLDLPILLCLNAAKTTRTMAALLQGLLNFEKGLNFCGIVFNNIGSSRHEASLQKAVCANVDLPVLGCLPRLKPNPMPERHMGLATRNGLLDEREDEIFEKLADFVRQHCDIEKILEYSGRQAEERDTKPETVKAEICTGQSEDAAGLSAEWKISGTDAPLIGYIRDAAFWFYYPENIEALAKSGADIIELSLLDAWRPELWQNLSGLYLGGGFPEDYAEAISGSQGLKFIAAKAREGMPVYAECGGLVLLGHELAAKDEIWPMADIFDISLNLSEKPQGLGYVEGQITEANPFYPAGTRIRGHEFHYSYCSTLSSGIKSVLKLARGAGLAGEARGLDGLIYKNVWASYTHIFAPAVPCWAANFVAAAGRWRKGKRSAAGLK